MTKLTLELESLNVESFPIGAEVPGDGARITGRCTKAVCTYTCP